MADYLIRFSYTPEAWRNWAASGDDRTPLIADAISKLGGELRGFWLAFGEHDGYLLVSADEPITPAALAVLDRAGGFVSSMETTVLLSVDEMLRALERANDLLTSVT